MTYRAKTLRRNMTDAERVLWYKLRRQQLGARFRRQEPIGRYIVDFVSFQNRLIVEIDGGQHCGSRRDEKRDAWLKTQGFRVIRFWNTDVLRNLDGVVETISKSLTLP